MRIKTIFWIVAAIVMLQVLPLYASLFSDAFKLELTNDAFGPNMSEDAFLMFEFMVLILAFWAMLFKNTTLLMERLRFEKLVLLISLWSSQANREEPKARVKIKVHPGPSPAPKGPKPAEALRKL